MKLLAVTAVIAVVLAGCAQSDMAAGAADTTIYSGGDILTMVGKEPAYTEALVVQDGKISFVGTKDEAMRRKAAATKVVHLQGHTLLPGFIDAHGHLALATHTLLDADLRGVKNIPELLERLRAHAAEVPEGQRIVGMGYRADQMEEEAPPHQRGARQRQRHQADHDLRRLRTPRCHQLCIDGTAGKSPAWSAAFNTSWSSTGHHLLPGDY